MKKASVSAQARATTNGGEIAAGSRGPVEQPAVEPDDRDPGHDRLLAEQGEDEGEQAESFQRPPVAPSPGEEQLQAEEREEDGGERLELDRVGHELPMREPRDEERAREPGPGRRHPVQAEPDEEQPVHYKEGEVDRVVDLDPVRPELAPEEVVAVRLSGRYSQAGRGPGEALPYGGMFVRLCKERRSSQCRR
jgi:hypothetical protein